MPEWQPRRATGAGRHRAMPTGHLSAVDAAALVASLSAVAMLSAADEPDQPDPRGLPGLPDPPDVPGPRVVKKDPKR
jgi:hypothetical protein